MVDTTALGAALFAGLGVEMFSSLDDIRSHWRVDRTFDCTIDEATREEHLRLWNQAIQRV
jgi:glycerol kinase